MTPRDQPIRVAALQSRASLDVSRNVQGVREQLQELTPGDRLDMVVLPEMFMFRALGDRPIHEVSVPVNSDVDRWLSLEAARLECYLVAGLLRQDGGEVFNETVVLDRQGAPIGHYRKTHLFDAPGQTPESDHVRPGQHLLLVTADFGTLGIVVCYELRFPEVARELAAAGAEMLVVPNSWPSDGTVRADIDLQILLRSTAVMSQAFVVHSNQVGSAGALDLCGGSTLLSPRGDVIAEADGRSAAVVVGELDLLEVGRVRATRLVLRHRRPELYQPGAVIQVSG